MQRKMVIFLMENIYILNIYSLGCTDSGPDKCTSCLDADFRVFN